MQAAEEQRGWRRGRGFEWYRCQALQLGIFGSAFNRSLRDPVYFRLRGWFVAKPECTLVKGGTRCCQWSGDSKAFRVRHLNFKLQVR